MHLIFKEQMYMVITYFSEFNAWIETLYKLFQIAEFLYHCHLVR